MLALALGLLACATENTFTEQPDPPPVEVGEGEISGRVCSPDGVDWLEGALVYSNLVDATGRFYDLRLTTTDADGRWLLEDVPAGYNHVIYVQYGDEIIDIIEVDVFKNERTELAEPECFDTKIQDVAVVTGDFDDFDEVLQALGIETYDEVDGKTGDTLQDFLLDIKAMEEYDLIVFNGGHIEEDIIYDTDGNGTNVVAAIINNLRVYVANGGSIYASDWAYDVVERGWPEAVDFLGTDEVPDDAQRGVTQTIPGSISNQVMAEFLNDDDGFLNISYDLPVWPLVERVSSTTSIHLLGNPEYRIQDTTYTLASSPLLISFNGGGGKIIYSTYRISANLDSQMLQLMQYVMFEL
jgi:hypothetical protein